MGAVPFVSHEVIDVTNLPRGKTLVNAIPCDGADASLRRQVCQAIAVFLLALDAAHKISLWNVRAELGHHWETAGDVALYFSMGNVGFHFQNTMSKVSQIECDIIADQLNNRPRKRHAYKTPHQCFHA